MILGFPAAMIGLLLVVAGHLRDRRGARLCGAVLLAFGLWDFSASSWRSPTGDAAIRIDLIFLLPIAVAAAIGGVLNLLARPLPPDVPPDDPPDTPA